MTLDDIIRETREEADEWLAAIADHHDLADCNDFCRDAYEGAVEWAAHDLEKLAVLEAAAASVTALRGLVDADAGLNATTALHSVRNGVGVFTFNAQAVDTRLAALEHARAALGEDAR